MLPSLDCVFALPFCAPPLFSALRPSPLPTPPLQLEQATTALSQKFYNQAQCVPALMHVLVSASGNDVRQMAAVELRKRVAKWWTDVDASTQDSMKKGLLEYAMNEEE